MMAISSIYRSKDHFQPAIDYLTQVLKLDPNNGDCWGSLGTKQRIVTADEAD